MSENFLRLESVKYPFGSFMTSLSVSFSHAYFKPAAGSGARTSAHAEESEAVCADNAE